MVVLALSQDKVSADKVNAGGVKSSVTTTVSFTIQPVSSLLTVKT